VVKIEGFKKGGGDGQRRDHSEKDSTHMIREKTCVSIPTLELTCLHTTWKRRVRNGRAQPCDALG
jgi:hypothetical protein